MNDYFIRCNVTGEEFQPSKFVAFLTGFEVVSMNDAGGKELVDRDVLGNLPFGSLALTQKVGDDFNISFHEFLNDVATLTEKFDVDSLDINIHLDLGYENQCNFELSVNEMLLLTKLNATFSITCYQKTIADPTLLS